MIRFSAFVFLFGYSILLAAQPFPAKPVEIVNSFAPGGALDLNVRALQVVAERVMGQPLVQIFKQGGGGVVGASEVASAAPDGYKLLIVSSGELTAAPNLTRTTYSIDSFAFLGRISSRPYCIVVNSKAPWKEFGEMLRAATGQPGQHTIGTTPTGGMFLTAQHFIKRGGVPITTVPYGGAGPAITALLGSHIDAVWAPLAAAESHVKAGTLRVLAVTGPVRVRGFTDTPSFGEFGIQAPYVQWVGVVAPKGVPAERLAFLRDTLARITKDSAYLEMAAKMGIEVAYGTAEEFEKQVRDEDQTFKALVNDLGLAP